MPSPTESINRFSVGQETGIAATPVQLPSVQAKRVRINNTGAEDVFIGPDNTVSSSNGYLLTSGAAAASQVDLLIDNLDQVWVVAATAGAVSFLVQF